jgi:hypothetical protein
MKIIQKKLIKLIAFLPILCLLSEPIHALNQGTNLTFDLMYEQIDVSRLGSLITNPDRMLEQTKESEYHTFAPGFELPILVMTVFPGINSDSYMPKVINCQTSVKSSFQRVINRNCKLKG